jgi:hypothetical protein
VEHVECILWPYGNLVGVWFIFSPFWYIVSRKIWQPGSIIRISKFWTLTKYCGSISGLTNGTFKNVVIMCGAGISTSAGVPDFRCVKPKWHLDDLFPDVSSLGHKLGRLGP